MARRIPVEDAASVLKEIKKGAVFAMPAGAAYCVACNALLPSAVERLKSVCSSEALVIAPSKKWIEKNFNLKKAFLDKLPGPFTYILKPKKGVKGFSSPVGVRLFEHPVIKAVEKANIPLLCAGSAANLKKLPLDMVDFAIDAGLNAGTPPTIIDFTGKFPLIVKKQA